MAQSISTNTFGVARWVVSPDPTQGTHTTISSALTSASSGDIIWVREGTYTENITGVDGVTLQALCSSFSSVVLEGSLTLAAGSFSVIGMSISSTGTSAIISSGAGIQSFRATNCQMTSSEATTLSISNSNAASSLTFSNCNILSSGADPTFAISGAFGVTMTECNVSSAGGSGVSTLTSGQIHADQSIFSTLISVSATGFILANFCSFAGNTNSSFMTCASNGGVISRFANCVFANGSGGTVSPLVVTNPGLVRVTNSSFNVAGATGVDGTGSVDYAACALTNPSGQTLFSGTLTVQPLAISVGTPSDFTANGQLYIGAPGTSSVATLTAGANITITNGPGAISIAAVGGGGSGFQVVNRQVFVASGTYTPTAGMVYCDVEVCGGGGGAGRGNGANPGSGGGGAGYARGIFSSTTIGVSQAVTIGAGGAGATVALTSGVTGGTTQFGALISATGGVGGRSPQQSGGAGGIGTGGDYQISGSYGRGGLSLAGVGNVDAGYGGSSFFGGSGAVAGSSPKIDGSTYGGGGATSLAANGGSGFGGIVIVTEYIGTGATIQNITYLVTADSPYTVLESDVYFSVDCSGGAVTLLFPDVPQNGQEWTIKDSTGSAAINNITATTVSGIDLIDSATSYVLSTNYQAINLIGTATPSYQVY